MAAESPAGPAPATRIGRFGEASLLRLASDTIPVLESQASADINSVRDVSSRPPMGGWEEGEAALDNEKTAVHGKSSISVWRLAVRSHSRRRSGGQLESRG